MTGTREKVGAPHEAGKDHIETLKQQVSHNIEVGSRPSTSTTSQRPGTSNMQRPGSSVGLQEDFFFLHAHFLVQKQL